MLICVKKIILEKGSEWVEFTQMVHQGEVLCCSVVGCKNLWNGAVQLVHSEVKRYSGGSLIVNAEQ